MYYRMKAPLLDTLAVKAIVLALTLAGISPLLTGCASGTDSGNPGGTAIHANTSDEGSDRDAADIGNSPSSSPMDTTPSDTASPSDDSSGRDLHQGDSESNGDSSMSPSNLSPGDIPIVPR